MINEIPAARKWLPKGTMLNNRYDIKGRLGDGGFSNTYVAVHRDMKNEVAIKEFYCRDYMYRDCRISNEVMLCNSNDKKQRDRDLENFLGEARILAGLSDVSGIVHVTDFFCENATAYIVMDFVKGISLEQQLTSGTQYSWDDILKKMLPVMEALSRVHDKKLIHRDIKPDNIIITEDGSLKLIDFGSALHYTNGETHSVYLTEGYAPKEQYLRSGRLDAYTDIYALCAVIYRCLTGCVPENSLQRSVFDELKKPSEMGILLPEKFERTLMKGLQIEPDRRWQSMDELFEAFSNCLPKTSGKIKTAYVISSLLAATAVLAVIFFVSYYKELKMRYLASDGELVEFNLEPPESMSAQEFSKAINIIKERAEIFAGNNDLLMETEPNKIHIGIPSSIFTAAELDENGYEEWGVNVQLSVLFGFSGKWRFHTPDLSHIKDVSPDHFKSVELKYGSLPIKSTSWDKLYTGNEVDWSLEQNYYIEIVFDDETADFMGPKIKEEGFLFLPIPHNEEGIYVRPWVSKGDGRTVYYIIGSSNCKNVAETMYQILTQEPFSEALIVLHKNNDHPASEEVSSDQVQSTDENQEGEIIPEEITAEITAESITEKDKESAAELCKKQLESLDIPYHMWEDGLTIHLQVPINRINSLVLYSLFDGNSWITTVWNERLIPSTEFTDISVNEHGGKVYFGIHIDRNSLDRYYVDNLQPYKDNEATDSLYLTVGNTRIGVLDSIEWENSCFYFELYLPEDGEDVIPRERMIDYLCQLIMEGSMQGSYLSEIDWKDQNGYILTGSKKPKLSPGLSPDRFSRLFSHVMELGGQAEFGIDWPDENIKITFNHWNGKFPEEALKIVEEIYSEDKLDRNLCSEIIVELHTWVGDKPARLMIFFTVNSTLQSIICTGYVDAADKTILDRAEKYVEESPILSKPETETEADIFLGSDWTYLIVD